MCRQLGFLTLVATIALAGCGGGASVGANPVAPGSAGSSGGSTPAASATPTGASNTSPSPGNSSAPTPAPSGGPGASPTATPTAVASGAAGTFASKPDADPFYAQPASFPNSTRGTILATRTATYAPNAATQPNQAWQLKFVSRDLHNNPIASVATVVKPLAAFTGGPEPLLAVQYFENSLGAQCAPSHSTTGSTTDIPSDSEGAFPLNGLSQGMTLVFPDHLGPNTEYGVGRLEGQITLDAIRAALQFSPLGLNAQTPVGMEGYSGGAIATAWAAAEQKAYAPELNIVAIASGGTPSNVRNVLKNFDTGAGNALFSLGFSVAVGLNREYPNFLTPILNAKGIALANLLKDGCGGQADDGSGTPAGHFADFTTVADPLDAPSTDATFAAVGLPQPGENPIGPMFIYQSTQDELISASDTEVLVKSWCAAGVHIAYYEGAQGEHIAFDSTLSPQMFQYLAARFRSQGDTVPTGTITCN